MTSTVVELNSIPQQHGSNSMENQNNNNNTNSMSATSNAILQRMKEMEMKMQDMQSTISNLETDNTRKAEAIKKLEIEREELSAERIKEMEEIFKGGIQDWVDSLKGVSDSVKEQFKSGILNIAKNADFKNHAWEVVCNASQAHKENVAKIEELVRLCDEKEKTIETLLQNNNDVQFRSQSSRMNSSIANLMGKSHTSSSVANNSEDTTEHNPLKRLRANTDTPLYASHGSGSASLKDNNTTRTNVSENYGSGKKEDAWDYFADLIKDQSKNTYF